MNNDKGFTLVEVIVALGVVAIVSSSLFQMFVTSSYVNKDARIMDIANVVAVQQAETFKADPASYSVGNINSYYFYQGDGTYLPPVYHDLAVIPAGAAIVVKSYLSDPQVTVSNDTGYNHTADFAGTIDLSLYPEDLDVNIKSTYEIGVEPAGSTFASLSPPDSSKIINNSLPIRVDFPTTGGLSRTINVINDSDVEAKFYIYYTSNPTDVIFNTAQGASSIAYVSPISTSSSSSEYQLKLTVYRVNNGFVSGEMLTYTANKYVNLN